MVPLQKELRKLANPTIAAISRRFFKTGKGDYGEGDLFLGIRVPQLRKMALHSTDLKVSEIKQLVRSPYHEERLTGLLIWLYQYNQSNSENERKAIYDLYIRHFSFINNWDLVDVTCPHIVGQHLLNRSRRILYRWARSDHLWTQRIAIITNLWFIRKGDLGDVFKLSEILLDHPHDLIHKAVGWVLREAGKKDLNKMEAFLKRHYHHMPRTMLRYAIEKFPETKRKRYLKGKV